MKYTPEEVIQFVQEENVRFIRLAFCNVYGKQHNVAIMPSELNVPLPPASPLMPRRWKASAARSAPTFCSTRTPPR